MIYFLLLLIWYVPFYVPLIFSQDLMYALCKIYEFCYFVKYMRNTFFNRFCSKEESGFSKLFTRPHLCHQKFTCPTASVRRGKLLFPDRT